MTWSGSLGVTGVQELAKVTPDLGGNNIDASDVQALAKALASTQVHTLDLYRNQIGDEIQRLLKEHHPNIRLDFILVFRTL